MQDLCTIYLLLAFTGILLSTSSASSWTYIEQDHWSGECSTGQKQSPINLETDNVIPKLSFLPFNFTNYDHQYKATVENNGHSVVIKLEKDDIGLPRLTKGGLADIYVLEQIHFHWGSEHTINNERFPLEMHLVHYAEKYGSYNHATLYSNGVAVLGVLFHFSMDDDQFFQAFLEQLPKIDKNPGGAAVVINKPLIASDFLPRDRADFFRYDGSLTTPSCNEGVIWTIFTNTLPISQKQRDELLKIWSNTDTKLTENYRSLQPLNGRAVYLRTTPSSASAIDIKFFTCAAVTLFGTLFCLY